MVLSMSRLTINVKSVERNHSGIRVKDIVSCRDVTNVTKLIPDDEFCNWGSNRSWKNNSTNQHEESIDWELRHCCRYLPWADARVERDSCWGPTVTIRRGQEIVCLYYTGIKKSLTLNLLVTLYLLRLSLWVSLANKDSRYQRTLSAFLREVYNLPKWCSKKLWLKMECYLHWRTIL